MHISEHLKDESSQVEPDDARDAERLWSTFNALDQTQLAVVITDAASVIKYVNQGFTRVLGYTSDDVIGRNVTDLRRHSIEDDQELNETFESGGSWHNEIPILHKDGSTVWMYNVVSPILDEDGVITHYVGIGEDISKVKQANDVLQRREDRYRVLVEKAQDVVYTTDSHGCFDYVNPRTFELTGYTRQETVGQRFTMLVHPDWQDGIESFYRQQLRDETPETLREFPIITKSGRIKWVEQTVVLAVDDKAWISQMG